MKKPRMTRGFFWVSGRGEWIRTTGLYVPNVALYQAKLHPVSGRCANDVRACNPLAIHAVR